MISVYSLKDTYKEAWSRLWKNYLAFYKVQKSDEIYDLTFLRLIEENNECEGYIAFVGGSAAGIVHCIYHLHLWQKEKICYLQDLFVDENYRKHGVATKLISQIYAAADDKKAKGVYWLTQDFNETARSLYDEIGVKTPFIKYTRT
ncbi:MAG: GNAT family N-acetyltransferase [Hyphomicrobiales bacterium]